MITWLFRKWCEWNHVHSWSSMESDEGRQMFCPKCRRIWGRHYFKCNP